MATFAADSGVRVVAMEWVVKSNLTLQHLSDHRISNNELIHRRIGKASEKSKEHAIDSTANDDRGKGY